MKNISTLKRYLIPSAAIFLLFSLGILLWPDEGGHSQPPPPPPIPLPGGPSVCEDIRNTKHNLSSIGPAEYPEACPSEATPDIARAVSTAQTTEICVFCHTPHGASGEATSTLQAPLWNRSLSTARYTLYDQIWSTSFEGYETKPKPNAPTGYSRLCLSCHDGTIAIGRVINPPGSGVPDEWKTIEQTMGAMHPGSGVTTGDTRFIGTNLQNDHPVSFVYDSSLTIRDEELVEPGPALKPPGQRVGDPTPISPLRRYPGTDSGIYDSVQCTSCHNPHAVTFPKFLRANYYNEQSNPSTGKIICLYCHDKPGWASSSHDISTFVPYKGTGQPSVNPYNYDGSHAVGQYACRACHDPHTAQGAKRLLREGVDVNNNFAIENTCFLCHRPPVDIALGGWDGSRGFPPDIRSEFYKDTNLGGSGSAMNITAFQGHEPVFVSRPQEGVELFSPAPPLFNEYTPGSTIQDTAHIECVDCHNPHQVTRTNRLKGMKGIDINGNVVGAKIVGNSREPYVHEVCLRCHGNSYTNLFIGDRFPDDLVTLPSVYDPIESVTYSPRSNPRAGTPVNGAQFSLKGYSNKRKEFDLNTPDTAPDHTQQLVNPAFHPVGVPGRNGTLQLCNQLAVAFNLDCGNGPGNVVLSGPFYSDTARMSLENLTITCTDCHNNDTFGSAVKGPLTGQPDGSSYLRATDVPPNFTNTIADDPSKPQGPHGSNFIRILRNRYNTDIENPGRVYTQDGRTSSHWNNFLLCFQCHDERAFNPAKGPMTNSDQIYWSNFIGRRGTSLTFWSGNLHKFHLRYTGAYCHECHYNVHSNVEATNTMYGDGSGGQLPDPTEDGMDDGVVDTHLINFAPNIVTGKNFPKPRWWWDGTKLRCDLQCHNVDMYPCFYGEPSGTLRACTVGRCT